MIWKPIPGWEDRYEVSDEGEVRNLDGLCMRQRRDRGGYSRVSLYRRGKQEGKIHRLVLAAFVGPCPDGQQVRHLDGNRANNRLENLAYGTPSENTADQLAHGTRPDRRGEGNGRVRLTEELVRAIRASDRTTAGWARELGIPTSTIGYARNGRTWRHL